MKLVISASPHIDSGATTRKIMGDVLIALCPALIAAIVIFGWRALLVTAVCAAACVFFEWGFEKLCHKESTIGDLSAVVTGVILAYNLPVSIPLWQAVFGCLVAIVAVKQLFGGIGDNFMNPALTARGIMLASWPVRMTAWYLPTFCKGVDAVSSATVLGGYEASTYDMFMGFIPGTIGEVSKIAILIGFAYLLIRKVISWRIPVVFVGTFAVLAAIFRMDQDVLTSVLSGGLLFGAVFMATDYTTSPMTEVGQYIYAFGCGLILAVIRKWGSYTEGVTYAILIMNVATPLIDKFVKIRVYGQEKPKKEVKANV